MLKIHVIAEDVFYIARGEVLSHHFIEDGQSVMRWGNQEF